MIRPDQVWRGSYCCAVTVASSYLTYVAARRYFHLIITDAYRLQIGNRVDDDMVVYFTLLGFHVAAIFFFCVFSFVSSRNFANDGRRFGNLTGCLSPPPSSGEERLSTYERRVQRLREKLHLQSQVAQVRPLGQQVWQNVIRSWQHFLPLSSVLHLASAYCLLLSQTVVKRACISAVVSNADRKSKVSPADVSTALTQLTDTELDHFFQRSVFFALPSFDANNTEFDANLTMSADKSIARCFDVSAVPLEFCNYVVSLLVLVFRYSAVVFCANRLFALLLGAALVLQSVTAILDYEAVSVLYRIDCCTHIRVLFLNVSVTALLITFGNCVLFIACVFIFEYSWKRMRRSLRQLMSAVGQQQSRSTIEMQSLRVGASDDCQSPSGSSFSNWYLIWREFSTHFHAHLLFVVGIILKIPYFWDLVVYYRTVGDALFLTASFVNAVNAFCWTAIWFLLTVTRNNWQFKILPPNHDGVPPCTRSCTVATILSATSIRMGESVHETELATDSGLQHYSSHCNMPLPAQASEYSQPTSCIYAKPNTLKFTAQSSKQSLKRKSILRSATQPEFPHASVALHENGPTHIHDQFDRVTLKINNPVTVISDANAGSSSPTVEPSYDCHQNERSYTCGRQTNSMADTISYQTGLMGIKAKSNTMMVRIQTPTESVSSDSGCLPQSGPASSSASKRLTPATATVLPLRIASPSLPSPTSLQSGLTSDLTNAASGPETGYTAGTETDASQSGSGNGDTVARNRPPSLIVDCPMHGYVYWPLQNTSELVYSEV